MCVVGLHTGAEPGHSAVDVQATHVFVTTSQIGTVPVQRALSVAVHSTQIPSGCLHTGVAPEQFASVVHPAVQRCVVVLHLPFGPVHWSLVLHWTQTLATTSHTGLLLVHALRFAAEHSTQLPVAEHAGRAVVGHAALLPEPRSPLHATQAPSALQIGVVPEHCELSLHCTQACVVSLQNGVVEPAHAAVSALVHFTHLPASGPLVTHAGLVASVHAFAAPVPKSPSHATHAPFEQLGREPEHSAFVRHSTQVFVVESQSGVGAAH